MQQIDNILECENKLMLVVRIYFIDQLWENSFPQAKMRGNNYNFPHIFHEISEIFLQHLSQTSTAIQSLIRSFHFLKIVFSNSSGGKLALQEILNSGHRLMIWFKLHPM